MVGGGCAWCRRCVWVRLRVTLTTCPKIRGFPHPTPRYSNRICFKHDKKHVDTRATYTHGIRAGSSSIFLSYTYFHERLFADEPSADTPQTRPLNRVRNQSHWSKLSTGKLESKSINFLTPKCRQSTCTILVPSYRCRRHVQIFS